jgi:hypothetical protein
MATQLLTINGYSVTWSIAAKTGTVFLHFATGQQIQIPVASAEELSTLGEILRHSPTVAYQPNGQTLITGTRPPGS